MKGYKAFYRYKDKLSCRSKLYEVGGTYEEEGAELCVRGMHFCKRVADCFRYYNPHHAVICEVEVPDECVLTETSPISFNDYRFDCLKACTTKLTVVRELTETEILELCDNEEQVASANIALYKNYLACLACTDKPIDARSENGKLKIMEGYRGFLRDVRRKVLEERNYQDEMQEWEWVLKKKEDEESL